MKRDLQDLTAQCIRCGFCLESCPTFTAHGEEADSPRGRIYLVRSAAEGKLSWQDDVRPHLDQCLGCRACETACPSGVEYGAILELARDRIEQESPQRGKALLLSAVTNPQTMRIQLALAKLWPGKRMPAGMSRWISGQPAEADLPRAELGEPWPSLTLPSAQSKAYLLQGCAMRVLFPRVNEATARLVQRVGVQIVDCDLGCCGALHAHNGSLAEARQMAHALCKEVTEPVPIVVNSAGCGSTMKEYGHMDTEFDRVAKATVDASEFLLSAGLVELLKSSLGFRDLTVTYHDACHLAHGQRIKEAPRQLIAAVPGVSLVELTESDMCCGSAGIYNVLQPTMARQLLDRKFKHIQATGASVVVTGNPGCHAWIGQAAREKGQEIKVVHTMEFLESAFLGRFRDV